MGVTGRSKLILIGQERPFVLICYRRKSLFNNWIGLRSINRNLWLSHCIGQPHNRFQQGRRMFESADNASWSVAEGHTGEYPFIVRYRQFAQAFPRSAYPNRLNVFWSMDLPDEHGLPSKEEAGRLDTFENRLIAAVEKDKTAFLVAVVTGRSEREFVFYLQQPQQFLQGLTDMPQEEVRYPIEIHLDEDPSWLYFDDLAPIDP